MRFNFGSFAPSIYNIRDCWYCVIVFVFVYKLCYQQLNTCLGTSICAQNLGTHTQIKKIKRKIKLSHQIILL
jgi:hypothetical protein